MADTTRAEFNPADMPTTPRHHIKYPGANDLVRFASQQFRAMAESIDDNIDQLPAEITDELNTATANAKKWRDEAEGFASSAGNIQDSGVAALIRRAGSDTRGALYGASALFIGDSYTQGFRASSNAARWSTLVAQHFGWSEDNRAVGGSGYSIGGEGNKTFLQQLQEAKAANATPDVIIIAGGRNDGNTTVTNKAAETFDYAHTNWPTARIVCIPALWADYRPISVDAQYRAEDIRTAARDKGVEVIWDSWQWLYNLTGQIHDLGDGNLDTHPNDQGYATVAKWVIQGLEGGPTTINMPRTQLGTYNTSNPGTLCVSIENGMVNVYGDMGANVNVYAGWTFARLPEQARPAIRRFVHGWTASGGTQALIEIKTDGVLTINNIYGTAGRNVGVTPISYPVGR